MLVDVGVPRSKRQHLLKSNYHFDCNCGRCSKDLSDSTLDRYLEADINGQILASDVKKGNENGDLERADAMIKLSSSVQSHKAVELLREAIRIRGKYLHKYNVLLLEANSLLLTLLIDVQEYESAIETAEVIYAHYKCMYEENHALTGLHLYTLGDLQLGCSMKEQAIKNYRESCRILKITHGFDHFLVRKLTEQLSTLAD